MNHEKNEKLEKGLKHLFQQQDEELRSKTTLAWKEELLAPEPAKLSIVIPILASAAALLLCAWGFFHSNSNYTVEKSGSNTLSNKDKLLSYEFRGTEGTLAFLSHSGTSAEKKQIRLGEHFLDHTVIQLTNNYIVFKDESGELLMLCKQTGAN